MLITLVCMLLILLDMLTTLGKGDKAKVPLALVAVNIAPGTFWHVPYNIMYVCASCVYRHGVHLLVQDFSFL